METHQDVQWTSTVLILMDYSKNENSVSVHVWPLCVCVAGSGWMEIPNTWPWCRSWYALSATRWPSASGMWRPSTNSCPPLCLRSTTGGHETFWVLPVHSIELHCLAAGNGNLRCTAWWYIYEVGCQQQVLFGAPGLFCNSAGRVPCGQFSLGPFRMISLCLESPMCTTPCLRSFPNVATAVSLLPCVGGQIVDHSLGFVGLFGMGSCLSLCVYVADQGDAAGQGHGSGPSVAGFALTYTGLKPTTTSNR